MTKHTYYNTDGPQGKLERGEKKVHDRGVQLQHVDSEQKANISHINHNQKKRSVDRDRKRKTRMFNLTIFLHGKLDLGRLEPTKSWVDSWNSVGSSLVKVTHHGSFWPRESTRRGKNGVNLTRCSRGAYPGIIILFHQTSFRACMVASVPESDDTSTIPTSSPGGEDPPSGSGA
jgi:hypothetical protein